MSLNLALFLIAFLSIFASVSSIHAESDSIAIQEWDIPTLDSAPHDIVVGTNGMIWFTEINTNKIGMFNPETEQFKEYEIPTPSSRPHGLVTDDAGNVWFTEVGAGKIGKLDIQTEIITEYSTPTPNSGPHTPIFSDQNTLWFTEQSASQIGKLDINTGDIEEFKTLTPSANPYGIITDEQGNAWFAELRGHYVGKVDAETGKVTEHSLPTENSGPRRIAIDSNGILWITQYNAGKIASFDPNTNEILEYDTSSESSGPYAIWVDPHDNVWFSMTGIYKMGKLDQVTQKIEEYDMPSPQTHIKFIHSDDKGNIWFPNYNNNKVGVILVDGAMQETAAIHEQQDMSKSQDIAYFPTPLKQIQDGIKPTSVTCTEGLELILKFSNGNPACIKSTSVEKLIERGWAIRVLPDYDEQIPTRDMITLKGEVWADNWFALYLDQDLIIEDSISINTERSFNSEIFTFDATYPIHLNFIVKDFKENDTGLEYIGTGRQQMGDGGFIAQFTNTHTDEIIAVTDQNVQCTAIHRAPLNPACVTESNPIAGAGNCNFMSEEEPTGWKNPHFDDNLWKNAIVYSENQVQPKDGYDKINWNSNAKLIWTDDLEIDNTILCRITIDDDSNIVESQQSLTEQESLSILAGNFDDGVLVDSITVEPCTLSGGTETSCYHFTVASSLGEDEIGPWCPRSIGDTSEEGGIWLKDGSIYDVDGEFVEDLHIFYDDNDWQLYDKTTGKINVTDSKEACEAAARPDVDESYFNHCVECLISYLDEVPTTTYYIPISPVMSTTAITNEISRDGVGIAFNGVKFDAPAPVNAILNAYTIAPFDDCGGHVNPHAGYHYHVAAGCTPKVLQDDDHAAMIGIALDGIALYETENEDGIPPTDLDSCLGHSDSVRGYHYHVADGGENMFVGCFAAEYGCALDSDGSCDASATNSRGPPLSLMIDDEKGYVVTEIASGVYWLYGSGYQTMFLTTGEGVIVIDAPKPIGEKYLDAINEVSDEPITHMIYSHHHPDHTGAAGEIFPEDITYIAHKDAADLLVSENDPARPIPNMILEGDSNTLEIGDKTIEFHNIGDFHSKGNLLILLPQHKIGMLVDLFRPDESPYRAFGGTPDIELYLETHDVLKTFDFDVLLTGHTDLLATKDHITTNKEFTQSIMDNAQDALNSGDSNPADACATNSIAQWEGKLGNLDAFMVDHCNAMIEYLQSK